MKKYLSDAGYLFVKNYNDITNRQFFLESATLEQSEQSTFNAIKFDVVEVYKLFLKEIDLDELKTKLQGVVHNAILGKKKVIDFSANVENVENGYLIVMKFNIKG